MRVLTLLLPGWSIGKLMVKNMFAVCIVVVLCGCATSMPRVERDAWNLSQAVGYSIKMGDLPASMSREEIVAYVRKGDADAYGALKGYSVHVSSDAAGNSVLLVCDKSGKRALVEDSYCTTKLDRRWWMEKKKTPCRFTLNMKAICNEN